MSSPTALAGWLLAGLESASVSQSSGLTPEILQFSMSAAACKIRACSRSTAHGWLSRAVVQSAAMQPCGLCGGHIERQRIGMEAGHGRIGAVGWDQPGRRSDIRGRCGVWCAKGQCSTHPSAQTGIKSAWLPSAPIRGADRAYLRRTLGQRSDRTASADNTC